MNKVKRVVYQQRKDHEWFTVGKVFYLRCCDCDLVHRMTLRVKDNRVELQGVRDERRTAACRRRRKGGAHESVR